MFSIVKHRKILSILQKFLHVWFQENSIFWAIFTIFKQIFLHFRNLWLKSLIIQPYTCILHTNTKQFCTTNNIWENKQIRKVSQILRIFGLIPQRHTFLQKGTEISATLNILGGPNFFITKFCFQIHDVFLTLFFWRAHNFRIILANFELKEHKCLQMVIIGENIHNKFGKKIVFNVRCKSFVNIMENIQKKGRWEKRAVRNSLLMYQLSISLSMPSRFGSWVMMEKLNCSSHLKI